MEIGKGDGGGEGNRMERVVMREKEVLAGRGGISPNTNTLMKQREGKEGKRRENEEGEKGRGGLQSPFTDNTQLST